MQISNMHFKIGKFKKEMLKTKKLSVELKPKQICSTLTPVNAPLATTPHGSSSQLSHF